MKTFFIFFLSLLPSFVYAGGESKPKVAVSFHMQGHVSEGMKFVRKFKTKAGEFYFRKLPEVSTKDIIALSPFPASDGLSYGLLFKLSKRAKGRLAASTSLNRGKLLLSMINGQPVDVVRIDAPIRDGMLVIWSGINKKELDLYDTLAPRIEEKPEQWKKRLKEQKKKSKKK